MKLCRFASHQRQVAPPLYRWLSNVPTVRCRFAGALSMRGLGRRTLPTRPED